MRPRRLTGAVVAAFVFLAGGTALAVFGSRGRAETVRAPAFTVPARATGVEAIEVDVIAPELPVIATVRRRKQERLTLPGDILFPFDEARLTERGFRRVVRIAHVLRARNVRAIVVEGHTDSRGEPPYNLRLSRQRALAVRDALRVLLADSKPHMEVHALGESDPKVDNRRPDGSDDPEVRRLNRRVEIVIVR